MFWGCRRAFQYHQFLFPHRLSVIARLLEAAGSADFGADTALNASRWIIRPDGRFSVHRDALRRTFDRADAAECTDVDIVPDLTPRGFKGRADTGRIPAGGGIFEQISQNGGGHREHEASRFYLSVQLIQGSMDKTITGTSDSPAPGSMVKRAGTLAKVGVRTRSRSRCFVPLALM